MGKKKEKEGILGISAHNQYLKKKFEILISIVCIYECIP